MEEQVNHPKHYNQHPAGIECIDIIRHYTCDIANAIKYLWRAGLKPEMGKEDAEKEIEDLKKALWYIEDYKQNVHPKKVFKICYIGEMTSDERVRKVTGYDVADIISPYTEEVGEAMHNLLYTGIVDNGLLYEPEERDTTLDDAIRFIQNRILHINAQLMEKDCDDINTMRAGYGVEGSDYVSKPGCMRETEPKHYDPLNIIIAYGRAYSLTDEVRKKDNDALYSPCQICALTEFCASQDGTESLKNLCNIHGTTDQQYYREVGVAKYSPRFGTVEVVDEEKEMEIELKRLEEENI